METISYTLPPEQDGATVRHILKAALHVSSHAISRLTRTENGIRVNGIHARTVDILHTGDVLEVETSDHRPPRVRPTPGPWPLPIVWEDGHLLVVNKPAGMTAHASNFLPDTPTVAGALDTYAKAILCDSPVYFSMVLPEPARELAWQTGLAPYQEVELEDSPFWTLGFHWHRPSWLAEWSVMNLLPDGAEGYTGTLFFSPLSEDNTYGIVYQQVAVRPDGDFWTVEPLGELEALRLPDEGAIPAPDDHIPHITYAAETVDLRLEVDLTYFLTCSDIWVGYMSLSDGGWAGGRTFRIGGGDRPSPVPAPHAAFTSCCKRSELRVERKSGGVPYDFLSTLAVLCVPLSSDGSPAFDSFVLTAYDLPGVSGLWHAAADDSGLEGLSALSLDFVYGNQRYTCTAYPAEVTP